MDQSHVVMVGPFPPPTHGMAVINASVLDRLRSEGAMPLVMDLSADDLSARLRTRLNRLFKALRMLHRLFRLHGLNGATLYMSVSGGLGKVYEICFALLARMKGMRLFLHHHSFAYLNRRDVYAQILIKAAGLSSVHIVLSERMSRQLRRLYRPVKIVSLSNAVFRFHAAIPLNKTCRAMRTIGFLANISAEKGVFDFLDLMAASEAENLPLRAVLAGPFVNAYTQRAVDARISKMQTVAYVGPKYGADKDDFFDHIDVFVFPTRYPDEAEPLTILEAMSHGVPVITHARGCIPEIVLESFGKVIDTGTDFVPAALAQLKTWLGDPKTFETASRTAARQFLKTYDRNNRRWLYLFENLLNRGTGIDERMAGFDFLSEPQNA